MTATVRDAAVDPKLMVALWLWATADGIGSARHLEKRCTEHLAYRWLCGGIEIGHQALRDFRLVETPRQLARPRTWGCGCWCRW